MANKRHRDSARAQAKALENRSARRKAKTNHQVPEDGDLSLVEEPAATVLLPQPAPVVHSPFALALQGLRLEGDDGDAQISEAAS